MDENTDADSPAFARVPTGVAGLDTILGGGVLRGGIYIVQGLPGAGKTILANQMCYAHIAGGGRAVYVTLVTESHARMIGHLRSLSFKNPAAIGDTLTYLSGIGVLAADGLTGLLDLARHAVRDHAATLLVIDGLASVQTVAGGDLDMRNFIQQLQLFLETVGCTTLLLMLPGDETRNPVQTMVDGVIALRDEETRAYPVRFLKVRKFRGSGYMRGDHSYRITNDGIVVHPRTEAVYDGSWRIPDGPRTVMPFDAPRLDAMLGRGILSGSTTLFYGAAGTGKTLLGLRFLDAGGHRGEPGLYFGFAEPPPRLLDTADRFGMTLRGATGRGTFELLWQPPLEQDLDALAERLFDAVARRGVRRLVIDALSGLQQTTLSSDRFPRFFAALTNELRARDVASIMILDVPEAFTPVVRVPPPVAATAENIILLRMVEAQARLHRFLSIIKMRDGEYDTAIREVQITDAGIDVAEVAETGERVEGILSGDPPPIPVNIAETLPASPQEPDDADDPSSRG